MPIKTRSGRTVKKPDKWIPQEECEDDFNDDEYDTDDGSDVSSTISMSEDECDEDDDSFIASDGSECEPDEDFEAEEDEDEDEYVDDTDDDE